MRIDSTTSSSTGLDVGGGTALAPTQDEFLKLFVAQLEHQDPLSPQDPSDMVAQLAQLTTVEQTAGLGARLDALVAQQASSNRASLLGLFGRAVEAPADHVTIRDGGADLPVVADLDRAAASCTLVVRDAAGQEIRRVDLGAQPAGELRLLDGLDLPPGTYQLELEAKDASGAAMSVTPTVRGTITAISFADDGAHLQVAGLVIDPADIASVS